MTTPASSADLPEQIEFNEQFEEALHRMEESSEHVFVTGRAGTGKSTLLSYFRETTEKNAAFVAPTGVAAVNIRGETIHSFFQFGPDITVEKVKEEYDGRDRDGLFEELDAIVIDEISMVRADLLDCVSAFLEMNGPEPGKPFGGVQMIVIGDLYQLPPVVTGEDRAWFDSETEEGYDSPYFFESRAFRNTDFRMVQLEKVYRQTDGEFLDLLNAIRKRSVTDEQMERLNKRVDPSFEPPTDSFFVHITTTNRRAGEINRNRLETLEGYERTFRGSVSGEFPEKALPTDTELTLREGAQVMMVNNDSERRWVNGTMGQVIALPEPDEEEPVIRVRLENGREVEVEPATWDRYRFYYDPEAGRLRSETTGSFTQYPLLLAWALTVHKSQGKTFDRVVIDFDRGTFAHGQAYVALSRCTSMEGLVLRQPLKKKHILMDHRVVNFMTEHQYEAAREELTVDQIREMAEEAIDREKALKMVYLKSSDEKSRREVEPYRVGEMSYRGSSFEGLEGFCRKRQADRVFRLDRILELEITS